MTEPNAEKRPLREKPQGERRFEQAQYDLLKQCSRKKDMTEWNEWRENHEVCVLLEGAEIEKAHLEGADLREVHLEGACLRNANLKKARAV